MHTGFWRGNPREGNHMEDPGVDERITLTWIFERLDLGEGGGHGLDGSSSG